MKLKQNKTKQNKTKQNKTKQNIKHLATFRLIWRYLDWSGDIKALTVVPEKFNYKCYYVVITCSWRSIHVYRLSSFIWIINPSQCSYMLSFTLDLYLCSTYIISPPLSLIFILC